MAESGGSGVTGIPVHRNPQGRTARDEYLEGRQASKVSATRRAGTHCSKLSNTSKKGPSSAVVADQLWNTAVSTAGYRGRLRARPHQSGSGDRGQTNELNAAENPSAIAAATATKACFSRASGTVRLNVECPSPDKSEASATSAPSNQGVRGVGRPVDLPRV